MNGPVVKHADGRARCWWCGNDPLYVEYHDREWGRPSVDDRRLFEMLVLEGFQSGLSWLTILRKREAFRRAFDAFTMETVARFDSRRVAGLLEDASIVRHRGKIESTINNARRMADLVDEFGSLASYAWGFEPDRRRRPRNMTWATLLRISPAPEAIAMSKDLRKRGWSFVGPTTVYSFMEACGIVNDHLDGCHARRECDVERSKIAFPFKNKTPER